MNDDQINFGYYLVAFVDLLGQKNQLRKLDSLPNKENKEEYKRFVESIKGSIGAVANLQKNVKIFFGSFTKNHSTPLDFLKGLDRHKTTDIKIQNFSDGLLIYLPLASTENYFPIKGIYGLLAACGCIMITSLARKQPVRIGLSVGVAAEVEENELYGKAIADAYDLESNIAQYPRAVASEELIKYLYGYANEEIDQNNINQRYVQEMAKICLNFFTRDYDGYAVVDYLGAMYHTKISPAVDVKIVDMASKFVDAQLELHQETQNSKLAFRYTLLKSYFDGSSQL